MRVPLYEESLTCQFPNIAVEFDAELNKCSADKIFAKSGKVVWWRCSKCNNTYQKEVYFRTVSNYMCPYCKELNNMQNSLASNFPELISNEWDYDKNSIDPTKVAKYSEKEAYWKCKFGHSYKMSIFNRTFSKQQCPQCNEQQKINRSLYSLHKELVDAEWDYGLNDIKPWEVGAQSGKTVWWKCKTCGCNWQSIIQSRTADHTGCPNCTKSRKTSFPEQAIFYYIKQYYKDSLSRDKHLGIELDIYIPNKNIAIEYDGIAWHTEERKQSEITKEEICKNNNIRLIRIREEGLNNNHIKTEYLHIKEKQSNLDDVIVHLLLMLGINKETINVNTKRDSAKIYTLYNVTPVANSLAVLYPQLAELWDIEANNGLLPENIAARSSKIVWWKCLINDKHKWQASLHNMTRKCTSSSTFGCPYCSGKRVLPEESFEAYYPDLALEWHPTKNSLCPSEVTRQSARKVWWICKNGHEWEEHIYQRAQRAHVCLFCAK